MGNAIVQATQKTVAKKCVETYENFKQLALSKDGHTASISSMRHMQTRLLHRQKTPKTPW
jgi:hypothetical protein